MRDYRVKPIDSLSRGLEVLQVLQEVRAAGLHDLHLATGIPKPTLTRIFMSSGHLRGSTCRSSPSMTTVNGFPN